MYVSVGEILINVMTSEVKTYYNLENIWNGAEVRSYLHYILNLTTVFNILYIHIHVTILYYRLYQ
jgi:hypothetical protein